MKRWSPFCLAVVFPTLLFAAQPTVDVTSWRAPYRAKVANQYTDYGDDLQNAGAYGKAAKVYALAAKNAETADVAGYATLCRADALYSAGKHFRALSVYKTAVETYPQSIDYAHATGMIRLLAEDFAAGRAGFWFIRGFHTRDAREAYRYLIALSPYGEKTGRDMLRLAELQRKAREQAEAVETYRLLINRFPGGAEARVARVELAETLLYEARDSRDSYRLSEAAAAHARRALQETPADERAQAILDEVNELQAGHYFQLGEFYSLPAHFRPDEARRYFERVVKEYPGTSFAEAARARLAELAESDEPVDPDTVPEKVRKSRALPDPGTVVPGLIVGDGPPAEATAPQAKEERQIKKWLLPLDDLDR